MTTHSKQMLLLAIANLPVFLCLGKLIFGSWDHFAECINKGAGMRGEWPGNLWPHIKLMSFTLLCVWIIFVEHDFFFG